MQELAITRGAEFVRFSRNARAIVLPDGCTVLGPLARLPHRHGDYAIRKVRPRAPDLPAEPPVVEGDVVVA